MRSGHELTKMKEEPICHQSTIISSPALLRSQKWKTSKMRSPTNRPLIPWYIILNLYKYDISFLFCITDYFLWILYLTFIFIIIIIWAHFAEQCEIFPNWDQLISYFFVFQASLENGCPGYSGKRLSFDNNSHNLLKKSLKIRKIKKNIPFFSTSLLQRLGPYYSKIKINA